MRPRSISPCPPLLRRGRPWRIPDQPAAHVVVVELLAPEQPGEGLSLNEPLVVGGLRCGEGIVKLVGIRDPACEHPVEVSAKRALSVDLGRQTEAKHRLAA